MEIVIYTDSDDTDLQIEIESRKAILTGRRIAGLPCGYQLHKYNRAVDRLFGGGNETILHKSDTISDNKSSID